MYSSGENETIHTTSEFDYSPYEDFLNPNLVKTDKVYAKKLLQLLYDCYEKELFCDVSVEVENKTFKTHCVVLRTASEYFKALLQMGSETKDTISLSVSFVTAELFEEILKFAYTGVIDFSDISLDTVHNLAIAADYLGMLTLKEFCEEHLVAHVFLDNVIKLLVSSEIYNMPNLSNEAKIIFMRNYSMLSDTQEFYDMPSKFLQVFLQNEFLAVYKRDNLVPPNHTEREKDVLAGVLKYIGKNIENNKASSKESSDLLKLVKLLEFDSAYLRNELSKFPKLETNPDILQVVELCEMAKKVSLSSENIPECWKHPRKLSYMFVDGYVLASGYNVVGDEIEWFSENENDLDPFAILKKITLWIRRWDGRPVLGALEFTDNNGLTIFAGEQNLEEKYEIRLVENEVITEVTASSGCLVYCLKFKTNLGNKYCPFGDHRETQLNCYLLDTSTEPQTYLHSFRGASVRTQGELAIVHLSCRWMQFID